jgi:hypothetical protein
VITQAGGTNKAAAALSTDPANVRETVRDLLLEKALALKNAGSLSVTFDYVVAADRQEAQKDAAQIAANPGAIAQLINAATLQQQASGGQNGGGAQNQKLSLAEVFAQPGANVGPLFGAPANSVVTFQPSAQQSPQWIVALVRARNTDGNSPVDTSQVDLATASGIGVSLLQPEATRLGVRISPRYGIWDAVGVQVVSGDDQTAGVEIPVSAAKQ